MLFREQPILYDKVILQYCLLLGELLVQLHLVFREAEQMISLLCQFSVEKLTQSLHQLIPLVQHFLLCNKELPHGRAD